MQQNAKTLTYVIRLTLIATIGGFLFGYDTAVVSGAIKAIREFFVVPLGVSGDRANSLTGFAVSCALIGCIIGGSTAGWLSLVLGRRRGLMLSGLLFLISGVGAAFPEHMGFPGMGPFTSFIFYRIIGGTGIGLASMLSPLYITEIAPPKIRGKLVSWNQFAIVLGIQVVYFVNWFIASRGNEEWNMTTGWRLMFLSGAIPSVIFIILLQFIPETPRYLVIRNRFSDALGVLKKTLGEKEAEAGIVEITESLSVRSAPWFSFGWLVILISILMAAFQQLTGINAVLYYAPKIFQNTGSRLDISLLQTILVGAVNLLFTIVAIITVDKFGRKPLLILGGLLMGLTMIAIGLTFYTSGNNTVALVFILIYIAGFAMSWGPVMWVLLSEIFPNSIRGAMSIATATVWITDLLVSWSFPVLDDNTWLVSKFNHGFPFWIYAVICFVAVIAVWKMVPETKGRSLEQIEKIWK